MSDENSKTPSASIAGFSTTARATVTFAPDQAARINEAAERSGESVMSFIRSAALERAERALEPPRAEVA
jgi:uncharacterized protein (DUF1778 family)